MGKKKYTLYSASDDRPNSVKPCAFFFSESGCRNGETCQFSHVASPPSPEDAHDTGSVSSLSTAAPDVQSSTRPRRSSSIISSNSAAGANSKKAKKEKKRKQVDGSDNGSTGGDMASATDQLRMMQKRMAEMERQLRAAESANLPSNGKGAVSSSNKSAKKEKHQTPGGATSTPNVGYPASSSGVNMSVSSTGGAPMSAGATGGGADGISRPKANFLSPPVVSNMMTGMNSNIAMSVSTSTKKAKRREEEEDTAFLFDAVNTVIHHPATTASGGGATATETTSFPVNKNLGATAFVEGTFDKYKKPKVQQQGSPGQFQQWQVQQGQPQGFSGDGKPLSSPFVGTVSSLKHFAETACSPFVDKESVMKTLQTSGTDHATGKAGVGGVASAKVQKVLDKMATANLQEMPWGKLLQKTQQNPRFVKDYNFEERADQTWVPTRAYGAWCQNLPPVIAIDCEMCQTTDPLTGERDNNALIRFSAVNGLNPSQVLVDQLVKPAFPITDSRAHIHGIPQERLEGVDFTLRHAQAELLKLCSDYTIIVGHSVHNDLKALRCVHKNCIDTSYLFAVENEPGASPSMRDVSEHILGTKLPELHDSVLDARAANQAAIYLLVQGCPEDSPTCPRTGPNSSSALATQLLAHRLPSSCTADHLLNMIMKYSRIIPESVGTVIGANDADDVARGKSVLTFISKEHANLVFDSIPGPSRPDKSNKAQKRIYLKGSGGYINLRKQL